MPAGICSRLSFDMPIFYSILQQKSNLQLIFHLMFKRILGKLIIPIFPLSIRKDNCTESPNFSSFKIGESWRRVNETI